MLREDDVFDEGNDVLGFGLWVQEAGGWDCLCHCHLAECHILNPFCAAREDRSGHGH